MLRISSLWRLGADTSRISPKCGEAKVVFSSVSLCGRVSQSIEPFSVEYLIILQKKIKTKLKRRGGGEIAWLWALFLVGFRVIQHEFCARQASESKPTESNLRSFSHEYSRISGQGTFGEIWRCRS